MLLSEPGWTTATWSVTDRLQQVLTATERLVSGTHTYDRGLSQLLRTDSHWLDVADRVRYKLAITVHRCLHNKAPKYLTDCCVAVSDIAGRQETALDVPHYQRTTLGHRAFSVADQPSGIRFQTSSEMRLRTLFGSH